MTPSAKTLIEVLDLVERLVRLDITDKQWQLVKPEILELLPPGGDMVNGRTKELRTLVEAKLETFKPQPSVAPKQPLRAKRGGG